MIKEGFEQYQTSYPSERILFEQGDSGECFYVIKEGLIGIFKEEGSMRNRIATIGPGEVLGEMALIDNEYTQKRSATAETLTEVVCWEFDDEQFENLMDTSESFREKIISYLTSRLRKTSDGLAKTKHLEDQLHLSSFLILKLINQKTVHLNRHDHLDIRPSIQSLASKLAIPPKKLKIYLSAPGKKHLNLLSSELEKKAKNVSRKIIDRIFSDMELTTAYKDDFKDETATEISNLEEACERAEELNNQVKSLETITRDQYESIWDDYNELKDYHEKTNREQGWDETLIRRLSAFLKGLRKKLSSINADILDE